MATEIPVSCISVPERQRPLDPKVVADLARSIEQHGLLQPIGIKPLNDTDYVLVFGAHRLEAFRSLRRETIPASILPANLSAEEVRLLELRENLDRNDLNGTQRKAFAAEVGRLVAKLRAESVANGNGNENENGNEGWLRDLAGETGIPDKTMYNWWTMFCQVSGAAVTPKQASPAQREQFFDWLAEQENERRRKAEESKAKQLGAACQDLQVHLDEAADNYGLDLVREWTMDWLRAKETHS